MAFPSHSQATITTYTYVFTGYGFAGSGAYSGFNDQDFVNGTFTLVDYANALVQKLSSVSGVVGNQNGEWTVESDHGSISLMSASVTATNANDSSIFFTYSSLVPAGANLTLYGNGVVQGEASPSGSSLYVGETNVTSNLVDYGSALDIISCAQDCNTNPPGYAYLANGQPAVATQTGSSNYLDYNFTGTVTLPKGDATFHIENFSLGYISSITISRAETQPISTVAGDGKYGYSGDGGPATSAELDFGGVAGIAVSPTGNLYLADGSNNRVRMVSAKTGVITTVAGNGTGGYSGDGGSAISAKLSLPTGVALDGAGNLYISDEANNRIRMVSATSGVITTVAGNGTASYSGDGGPATSAELNYPTGVALDGFGNLYIADRSNNRIRMVSAKTGLITTVAGNGTDGFSGDGGAATDATLTNPTSVMLDGAGNLYIADTENGRIRKVTAATGAISTVAGGGTAGSGYSGDGGPATSATLYNPTSVVQDGTGNLYIADSLNNRIRMVSATSGVITTVVGNGAGGYSGDGGPATVAELNDPNGVVLDGAGDLYIADNGNDVVREVTELAPSASPPVVTPVLTGTLGKNGWYTSNVQVSWTVSAGASPIASESGCGTVTISTDTSGQTLTCSATSAGGTTTTRAVTIKRDATSPTASVSSPSSGATYKIGSTVAAAYSCADSLSGVASCIGTVADGAPISTAATGSHSFTVTATDLAGNVTQSVIRYTVAAASQTITFGPIASQTAGKTLALQATASSGLPVTFTSSTIGVCTVSNSTATLLSAGTCTITASQAGNGMYAVAPSVQQSFTVVAAGPPFSLKPTTSPLTLQQNEHGTDPITVTDNAGFSGAVTLSVSGAPTGVSTAFTGNDLVVFPALTAPTGTYPLTITGTSGTAKATTILDLVISPAASFRLTPAAASVSVSAGTSSTDAIGITPVAGFAGTVAFTAAGLPTGATATFSPASSKTSTILTLRTAATTPVGSHGITVTGSVASTGNSNAFAETTTVTLVVTAALKAQTISFPAIGSQNVGIPLSLNASASSGLSVSFAASPASVCTIAGGTAKFLATGTCTITASQAGNSTYAAATPISQSVYVGAAGAGRFTLKPESTSVTVTLPSVPVSDTITLAPADGFTGPVTFSISGLPTGVTSAFSPASVTTSASTTLKLTPSSSAASSQSTKLTIKGTSGSLSATTTVTLNY